jgi:hypothetical protein
LVVSSKEEIKKKRVWRQFCDCLSEAVAHLPAALSQLLLEALLIADLRNELNTHLAQPGFVYLEFSWAQQSLLQTFPSASTLGEVALHPPSPASLFIYRLHGKCPFPLSSGTLLMTVTVTSFPAPRLLGRGHHSCLLKLARLFTVP